MEYQMLYVESRKSFKDRTEKKTYYFMQLQLKFNVYQLKISNSLNKFKLSNGSKKLPKSHMNQSMFSIAYTKSFEVKPNSIVTLTINLTESLSMR